MIAIRDLSIRIGGRPIVDHASAQLGARQRVGLVGRNGAGKTTLLHAIAGRLEPDGGEIIRPNGMRLALIAQDAPSGPGNALDCVLVADTERSSLLAEAEAGAAGSRALSSLWSKSPSRSSSWFRPAFCSGRTPA